MLTLIKISIVFHIVTWNTFPIFVVVLNPALEIFMASSIYMTVAVAVNRCLEMRTIKGKKPRFLRFLHNSGVAQALTIFICANVFILPRWFEQKIVYTVTTTNVTLEDNITTVEVNVTVPNIGYTWLGQNYYYNLYYWVIMYAMCFVIIPVVIMLISSILLLREMRAMTKGLRASTGHQRTQEKRNGSVTLMLIGIIVLFVICHMPKIIFACYRIWGGLAVYNELWVLNLIIVKDTLSVANSSLNFAIYCKDLLFRKCAKNVYNKFLMCTRNENASKSTTIVWYSNSKGESGKASRGETSRCSEVESLQSQK